MYCCSRAFTMPEPAVLANAIEDAAGVHLTELP
jgi:CO/xanthine dehydrogenase Mo-binding subunit